MLLHHYNRPLAVNKLSDDGTDSRRAGLCNDGLGNGWLLHMQETRLHIVVRREGRRTLFSITRVHVSARRPSSFFIACASSQSKHSQSCGCQVQLHKGAAAKNRLAVTPFILKASIAVKDNYVNDTQGAYCV